MSKLSAFLNPVKPEEKDVYISDRFRDEDGNVVPFRIRPLMQEETDAITRKATRHVKINGVSQDQLDTSVFSRLMVLASTVNPDFSSTEMCEFYKVLDPSMVPGKMLLSGEYAKLMQEITDLSGFNVGVEDEAKN